MVGSDMTSVIRRKKIVKKGVAFTLMVCGASGTGRTTFINTLCNRNVLPHEELPDPGAANLEPGINIKPISVELDDDEKSRVSLTIVDTPGFGDNIDNEKCFNAILEYLEHQYDDILTEESRIRRNPRFKDSRVHCLLYFITPTGHGLRELDIELMRRLSPRVNVIPVIGKADSFTSSELSEMKKLVMEDIEYYKIPIYNFPYDVEEDDVETIEENSALRSLLPFAIVGSEEVYDVHGVKVRGRQYPWGLVEVEDSSHSDFIALKSALLGSHLIDLRDITHDFLYENYRTEKLSREVDSIQGDRSESMSQGKDDALRREEERLQEMESKMHRELVDTQHELHNREEELHNIESRLAYQHLTSSDGSRIVKKQEVLIKHEE